MIDIATTIRRPVREKRTGRIPYADVARYILGESYELSLLICGDSLARRINREYRQKTYSPNVLSFPLSKTSGEIVLNIRKAEREAAAEAIPTAQRLLFLFIHGCLHLAGHDHSDEMEALEDAAMKKFSRAISS